MAEKHLTEAAWKAFAKGRNLKDAALAKALADWSRAERDAPPAQLQCLDGIDKQVDALAKAVKADKDAAAYLVEMGKAVARARQAAKAAKETKDKEAKQTAAKADADDDSDTPELLTTRMLPLLKLVAKGDPMQALVAVAGKQVAVMLSRRPIAPARRKLLAEHLSASGGVKYFAGHCQLEDGATTFVLEGQVAGLAKRLKTALLDQTGLKVNKLRCRGEDGLTDEDDDAAPGGAPLTALGKARADWDSARAHAVAELKRLKDILASEYRDAADQQTALATALQRVDATIAGIDEDLARSLDALIAAEAPQRAALIAAAKTVLSRLVDRVDKDPVLQTIDGNELAPEMVVAAPLRERLRDVAASLA
jgi:hypothetical protein